MDPNGLPSASDQQSGTSQTVQVPRAQGTPMDLLEQVLIEACLIVRYNRVRFAFTVARTGPLTARMATIAFQTMVDALVGIDDKVDRFDANLAVRKAAEHLEVTAYQPAGTEKPSNQRMRERFTEVQGGLVFTNLCDLLLGVCQALGNPDAKAASASAAQAITAYGTTNLVADAKTLKKCVRAGGINLSPAADRLSKALTMTGQLVYHLVINFCTNAEASCSIVEKSAPEVALRYINGLAYVTVRDGRGEQELAIAKLLPAIPMTIWPELFKLLQAEDRLESPVIACLTAQVAEDPPTYMLVFGGGTRQITTITWSEDAGPVLGTPETVSEANNAFDAMLAVLTRTKLAGLNKIVWYVRHGAKSPTYDGCVIAAIDVYEKLKAPVVMNLGCTELWGSPIFVDQDHTADPLRSISVHSHLAQLPNTKAWTRYQTMLWESKQLGDTQLVVIFDLTIGTGKSLKGSALVRSGRERKITLIEGSALSTGFQKWFTFDPHMNDGEAVAISALATTIFRSRQQRFKVKGCITFLQSQGPCVSCRHMTHVFRRKFPGIDLVTIYPRISTKLLCTNTICPCQCEYGFHGMMVETDRIRDERWDTIVVSKRTIAGKRYWYCALPAGGVRRAPRTPDLPQQMPPQQVPLLQPQYPFPFPYGYLPQMPLTTYNPPWQTHPMTEYELEEETYAATDEDQYPETYPTTDYPQTYAPTTPYYQYPPMYSSTPYGHYPPPGYQFAYPTVPYQYYPPTQTPTPTVTPDLSPDVLLTRAGAKWTLAQEDVELIRLAFPRLSKAGYEIVLGSIDLKSTKEEWLALLRDFAKLPK